MRRIVTLDTQLTFTDGNGEKWIVPKGAVVDGASVPPWAWSFIGTPFVGKFRAASIVHDFYCDTKTRPWKDVHDSFYFGLMAAEMTTTKALVMWSAVRFFGPRWRNQDENGNCIDSCNSPEPEPAKYNKEWFRDYVTWP